MPTSRNRSATQTAFRTVHTIGTDVHGQYSSIQAFVNTLPHIITQNSDVPGKGEREGRGNGLRNSECLSPSQTCPRQSVPRKEKSLTAQSVPPGKKLSVRRHRPSAQERTSDARHCTISGTIFSLILSIVHSLVYYKEHTSNLLTLKSESVILWSS